jgi:hypothetical protein
VAFSLGASEALVQPATAPLAEKAEQPSQSESAQEAPSKVEEVKSEAQVPAEGAEPPAPEGGAQIDSG